MDSQEKEKTRRKFRVRKRKQQPKEKDFNKLTGILLVLFGIAMCAYSFGALDNPKDLFQLGDFSNLLQLWPIYIVIAGFIFLIRDYFKRSENKKWDS